MNRITTSVFRLTFTTISEPTIVTHNGADLGTWTPATVALEEPRRPIPIPQRDRPKLPSLTKRADDR